MDEATFEAAHAEVVAGSRLRDSYAHGERHWRAVAFAGLELIPATVGADPNTVLLFALFHDARRENEWEDPEHGLRSAELGSISVSNPGSSTSPTAITRTGSRPSTRRSASASTPIA